MFCERKSIIISSDSLFTLNELKTYEEKILDNKNCTENMASIFFLDYPKFLSIGGYSELRREVVLSKNDDNSVYRVDFFRRRYGSSSWDIVELKSPQLKYIVKNGKHWKFSSSVEKAISQVYNYRDFFEDETNRNNIKEKQGILIYRPKMLIIAGRDGSNSINEIDLIKLKSRFNDLDIESYDDLYKFATENYQKKLFVIPIFFTNTGLLDEINYEINKLQNEFYKEDINIASWA